MRGAVARAVAVALGLGLLTIALRGWIIGNPNIDGDEQFYLLVGQRMAAGLLPYVDIFDVKPVGLFVIYQFAARAFANSVVGYQVLAALSVWLTALVLYRLCRQFASVLASGAAAAAYVAWLAVFQGIGGQSPIFYNLPMVLAAAMAFGAARAGSSVALFGRGVGVMAFVGLALQIKYSVLFEGVFFGLLLLHLAYRRHGAGVWTLLFGLAWIVTALVPTAASLAWFNAAGAFEPYWQANFVSILYRQSSIGQFLTALARLFGQQIALSPFWFCLSALWRSRKGSGQPEGAVFVWGWLGAAFAGYVFYGTWSEHFVLPLLLPLCVMTAMAIDRFRKPEQAAWRLVVIGVIGGLARAATTAGTEGGADDLHRVAALVRPYLGHGCLYVANAPSSLYSLTGACLATRYVFPSHLTSQRYAATLGSDPREEMRQLIGRKPAVIIKGKTYTNPNVPNETALMQELHRHYEFKAKMRIGVRWVGVWVRRPN